MTKTSFELMYLAVCLLSVWRLSTSFPSGSPDYMCRSMKPLHRADGQPLDTLPFSVTADPTTVRPGGVVTVTIRSQKQSDMFQGILAVASDANENVVSGMITPPESSNLKRQDCKMTSSLVSESAITHTTRLLADTASFQWRAPLDAPIGARYTVRVTIVMHMSQFWVGVPVNITIGEAFVPPQVSRTMTSQNSGTMTSQNSGTMTSQNSSASTSTQQVQRTTGVNNNAPSSGASSAGQRVPPPARLPPSPSSTVIPQSQSAVGSQFSQLSSDTNMVDNGTADLSQSNSSSNNNRGRVRGNGGGMRNWLNMWFQRAAN